MSRGWTWLKKRTKSSRAMEQQPVEEAEGERKNQFGGWGARPVLATNNVTCTTATPPSLKITISASGHNQLMLNKYAFYLSISTSMVTGQNSPGHVPPGHLPQGHVPPWSLTPGHVPPGHLPPRTHNAYLPYVPIWSGQSRI